MKRLIIKLVILLSVVVLAAVLVSRCSYAIVVKTSPHQYTVIAHEPGRFWRPTIHSEGNRKGKPVLVFQRPFKYGQSYEVLAVNAIAIRRLNKQKQPKAKSKVKKGFFNARREGIKQIL